MRPARSRRVQAQRKFAQGAYVPPNVTAVVATETRREPTQDARNITINHMAATSLLDVVSLQNAVSTSERLGLTSQPVVLIERLRGRHLARDVPPPTPKAETSQPQHLKSTIKKPADPPSVHVTRKRHDCKRVHGMSLRSRRLSVPQRGPPLKRKVYSSDEDDEPLIFQKTRKKGSFATTYDSNAKEIVSKAKSTKNIEVPTKSTKNIEVPTKFSKIIELPAKSIKNVDVPAKSAKNIEVPTKSIKNTEAPAKSTKNTEIPAKSTKNIEVPRKTVTKALKTSLISSKQVKEKSPQKKVPEKSPQKKIAENGPQKKIAENGPQKKIADNGPQKKIAENGPQKKIADNGPQKKIAENGSQKKIAENGPQKKIPERCPRKRTRSECNAKQSSEISVPIVTRSECTAKILEITIPTVNKKSPTSKRDNLVSKATHDSVVAGDRDSSLVAKDSKAPNDQVAPMDIVNPEDAVAPDNLVAPDNPIAPNDPEDFSDQSELPMTADEIIKMNEAMATLDYLPELEKVSENQSNDESAANTTDPIEEVTNEAVPVQRDREGQAKFRLSESPEDFPRLVYGSDNSNDEPLLLDEPTLQDGQYKAVQWPPSSTMDQDVNRLARSPEPGPSGMQFKKSYPDFIPNNDDCTNSSGNQTFTFDIRKHLSEMPIAGSSSSWDKQVAVTEKPQENEGSKTKDVEMGNKLKNKQTAADSQLHNTPSKPNTTSSSSTQNLQLDLQVVNSEGADDNFEGRRLSISSDSTEINTSSNAVHEKQCSQSEKSNYQRFIATRKRLAELKEKHERLKQAQSRDIQRIEELKQKEIAQLMAEKKDCEAENSRLLLHFEKLHRTTEKEFTRLAQNIKDKMRAELEEERRLMEEVDTMAETLNREKDAKSMHPRQSTGGLDDEPGTSESTEGGTLKDAPVYFPSTEEFQDPITFYEKIYPEIIKYGVCKVVPPPTWKPPSEVHGDIRFDVMNQYISRLFSRWGPAARELSAIKMCLHHQNINFTRAPQLDGVEINLSKLYHLVQRLGGLETVINKKRWGKVADDMKLRGGNYERRLEQIYMKYLLPYDTLSHQERQEIMHRVEIAWNKKNQKLLDRAMNPLYRQKRMLGLMDSSDDEAEEEDTKFALKTAEDCILKGHLMQHSRYFSIYHCGRIS
ncbi:hypothetical protein PYW08_000621 [Mythimna loreyi]|uniref:Uncharacterized protein n=1 Tax=Mythimna loreyi TaxID=667449 RepID=A0ACC2RD67_9NEOP|nr:hypothetical protein PYW08_000621 [Mythimna loreyi]